MVLGSPNFMPGFVSLDCMQTETARVFFFSESFSKKETALTSFFLLLVPVQCLDKTYLYLIVCPVT